MMGEELEGKSHNAEIAKKIEGIVKSQDKEDVDWDVDFTRTEFQKEKGNISQIVSLSVVENSTEKVPELKHLLSDFSFPVMLFETWDVREATMETTSGDVLPEDVLASDGKLYHIRNYYFLDWGGNAIKVEQIDEGNVVASENESDYEKIAYVPTVGVNHKRLEAGDYELIESQLAEIDAGNFELLKARPD